MFVFNYFLEQTGTIIYENDQELVSGLVSYQTPFTMETGTRFAVVDNRQKVRQNEETNRSIVDVLKVQFGAKEVKNLNDTGIYVREGRTRLRYNGVEYRATYVNNFGNHNTYIPIGITEVIFERRVPVAK